jgi:putative solute:sodium symporter small subunit
MPEDRKAAAERHWSKTLNLTIWILIAWFVFGFIAPWFAKSLNSVTFMGFPLGYYMCVQGSLIAFVALIWIQNWVQDGIDDEFDPSSSQQQ